MGGRMLLGLAIQGKLSEVLDEHYKSGATAVTKGIGLATIGLKDTMRKQVKNAGLSNRLANTWRGDVYPKGKSSIKAAGLVYSKANKIMQGFEYGSTIKSKNGFWIAIPAEAIPKKIMGKRTTPALYEKSKGIKLRFIYRANGVSFLVHEQRKKTIIVFLLVRQVKMPK